MQTFALYGTVNDIAVSFSQIWLLYDFVVALTFENAPEAALNSSFVQISALTGPFFSGRVS